MAVDPRVSVIEIRSCRLREICRMMLRDLDGPDSIMSSSSDWWADSRPLSVKFSCTCP